MNDSSENPGATGSGGSPAASRRLRNLYLDVVYRTNRLLVTSLSILFVLAVVLIVETREQEKQEQQINDQINQDNAMISEAQRALSAEVDGFLKILEVVERSIPERKECQKTDVETPESCWRLREARDSAKEMKFLLRPFDAALSRETQASLVDQLGSLVEQLKEGDKWLSQHLINLNADKPKGSSSEAITVTELSKLRTALKKLISNARGRERGDRAHAEALRRHETVLEELRRREESIPTPIGSFAIKPRLGLFLVTVGSFAVFAFFSAARARTGRLFEQVSRQELADKAPMEAPFWLHPLSDVGRAPSQIDRHGPNEAASVVFHLSWILLGTMLVASCLHWNTPNQIAYVSHLGVNVLLLTGIFFQIGYVVTVVLLAKSAREWLANHVENMAETGNEWARWRQAHVPISRRQLILGVGVIIVAGIAWRVFPFLLPLSRNQGGAPKDPDRVSTCQPNFFDMILEADRKVLLMNARSRIVHHQDFCARHLPRAVNQLPFQNSELPGCLHSDRRTSILEVLARKARANSYKADSEDEAVRYQQETVHYLQKAIAEGPLNLRLYDKLVRVYGQMKKYHPIDALLKSGTAAASKELDELRASAGSGELNVAIKRREARLERTLSEFRRRVQRAEKRARKS